MTGESLEGAEETQPPSLDGASTQARWGVDTPPQRDEARPAHELERGSVVGRYTILERLGAGGMGVVYAAFDETLDRKVALKMLRRDETRRPRSDEPSELDHGHRRMLREAQAMARLSHPNVVTVHDVDTYDDRVFLAMEYVEGRTLGAWLAEDPKRTWPEIVDIFVQAAAGLAAAHAAGLVHRDFKPDNVMLGRDGRVRVMDFGLARAAEASDADETTATEIDRPSPASPETDAANPDSERGSESGSRSGSGGLSDKVTRTGAALGTPAYMSPEQHRGEVADARSDQFSFCVALYQALYGRRPFPGSGLAELSYRVTHGELEPTPADASNPRRVPSWVYAHLVRGLAVDPSARWPDMQTLAAALADDPRQRRRRWLARGGIVLGGLGLVGLMFWQARSAERSCEAGASRLVERWAGPTRAKAQSAFEATALPFASRAFARSSESLEHFAKSWEGARRDACRDSTQRGIQSETLLDLRIACLERRAQSFDALVSVFEEADPTVVEGAIKAATSLPELEPCADAEVLTAEVAPPPAQQAEAVASGRAQLARARALEVAGRFDEALELATAVRDQAKSLVYPPLRAEAEFALAWAQVRRGEFEDAEASLLRAYRGARTVGDDRLAAETQALLTYVLGDAMSKHDEGLMWGQNALADVAKVDQGGLIHAVVMTNLGSTLTNKGDTKTAIEHHRAALGIYESRYGEDHPRVAAVLNNLGIALNEDGDAKAAVEVHRRALAMRQRIFGPDHPDVATSLQNLGNATRRLGNYEEALQLQTRALEIREGVLGPDHPRVASAVGSLGIAYAQSGDLDRAVELFRDSSERYERGSGPDAAALGDSLANLAQGLTMQGKYEEAETAATRALEIRKAKLGPEHPLVANSLNSLGELAYVQEKMGAAREHVREALAIQEKTLAPDHPSVAVTLIRLGDIELAGGDPKAALERFERVLAIRAGREGEPLDLAEAKFAVARALQAANRDRARADSLLAEAEATFTELGPAGKAMLDEVAAWRGEQER